MSTSHLTVSVILPAYNAERFVGDAIDSILAQTYHSLELIVVDDGSTDNTSKILRGYGKRLRVITNERNEGIVKSLNSGIATIKGEFIARQDADDISTPTRIEKQVSYMRDNPDCALLGTARVRMSEDGAIRKYAKQSQVIERPTLADMQQRNLFVHGSMMMRKAVLQTIGNYSPIFHHAEDYELWMRFLANGYQAAILSERLYATREHAKQISHEQYAEQTLIMFMARDLHNGKITPTQAGQWAKDIMAYYPELPTDDKVLFHQGCATSAKIGGNHEKALKHYRQMRKLTGWNWKIVRNVVKMKLRMRMLALK